MYKFEEYLKKKKKFGNVLSQQPAPDFLGVDETAEYDAKFISKQPLIAISNEIPFVTAKGKEGTMRIPTCIMKCTDAEGVEDYYSIQVGFAMEMMLAENGGEVSTDKSFGVKGKGFISKTENATEYNRYSFRIDPYLAI